MMLSSLELKIFEQYQIGVTKKEFDKDVLKSLHDKELINFNMGFVVLTKQGKRVWDSVGKKNNIKNPPYLKNGGGKKIEDWLR